GPATAASWLPQRCNYRTGDPEAASDFGPVRSSGPRLPRLADRPRPPVATTQTAARRRPSGTFRNGSFRSRLLRVAALELVDAAAGVDDLVLTGVERMRRGRHFDLDQRIFLAVVPLDRLLRGGGQGRAGEEPEIGSHVLEDDFAVFGVDVSLHGVTPLRL